MFRGRHTHTIDSKGRVSVPAKFREILAEKHGNLLILTSELDNCLVAFPPEEWRVLEDKVLKFPSMNQHVSKFLRFFISGAEPCPVDGQGRILIPPTLRRHAALNKEVMFVGLLNKIELWDVAQWNQTFPRDETQIQEIRQAMADLGL
ncbi:MAG: division/cell wall cluster transcriptional repressor MraZ [Nitrospirae bacterium]|nr:division/cell wall cluster transcriptional repressor MraZ [Nitrospirota bacterium]